tara:strand:- start:2798 stop:3025 length:228 start_codon:yes stop_codon:yes gene_type:complete
MRARYVSDNRARVRIFTNDVTILTYLHRRLISEGFQQVSFIKFWVHVLTAGRRGFVDPLEEVEPLRVFDETEYVE